MDFFLLLLVLGLVIFGLIMIYSSSFIYAQERTGNGYAFIQKQMICAVLGFFALIVTYQVDYRHWYKLVYPVLGLSLLALVLVEWSPLGVKVGGAKRWLSLGILNFQPAELVKFGVILFVSRQLVRNKDRLATFSGGLLANLIVPMPLMIMILFQPDLGSTVIIACVIWALMFLAGVPMGYLWSALMCGAMATAALIFSSGYRQARFFSFVDPWQDPNGKGFQILQSLAGLHNGGVWGVGLGNGKEKLFFLPEAHNDFIFAVMGEELGFVGVILLVLTFVLLVIRGFKIAWKSYSEREDSFGFYLAAGITILLGTQAFLNMGVVMGMLPTKGLPLPFVSYGGTALLMNLCLVGVLLSISRGPRERRADLI